MDVIDEAVNARVGPAAAMGDREIVRGAVGPESSRISYLTAGSGAGAETILLIHGAGVSARSWIQQLQGLSGTLRVLALDLPGHGESAPIQQPRVEGYADTARRLLEALNVGPVWVAGHSLGGAVAQALAARHPRWVKGLVLVSTCAKLPETDGPLQRITWLLLPSPVRKFLFFLTVKKVLFAPGSPRQAIVLGMEEIQSCRRETLMIDVAMARAMDLEETTRTVGVPTLIVCGSLDRLTAPELSRRLKELIPESRLDIIEGAGHMLPLETPEALNKKILHFVSAGEATDLHQAVTLDQRAVRSILRRLLERTRAAFWSRWWSRDHR